MTRSIRSHAFTIRLVTSIFALAPLLFGTHLVGRARPADSHGRSPQTDSVALATGAGLTARYYNDSGNGLYFSARVRTQTDAQVNFSWGAGSPGSGVQTDNFSVRWFGLVEAPVSGSYTFTTTSDDGVRLWVDNQLVVDNWTDHTSTTNSSGAIALVAGQRYQIAMEYYDHTTGATAVLSWAYPGQALQTIPQSRLYTSSVRLDRVGPTVSITSPTIGQLVSGAISVGATATDNTGVVGVQFTLDDAPIGAEDTSAPYSVSWNTALVANGSHSLKAIGRDQAGNTRTSPAVTVNVSNVAGGPVFYVSPTGSPSGTGSIAQPWDLQTALNQPAAVVPGATIYLRGGTYHGAFTSALTGQAGAPVTVRQYAGERAVIDGNGTSSDALAINGSWAVYWGFEVMNSGTVRNGATRPTGVDVYGPNVKLVNLVVHDNGNGIGFWEGARDSEVNGCILFNNGWIDPSNGRGTGYGMYIQNNVGSKRIADVVCLNSFGFGFHAYGEGGHTNGLHFENNASFNNGSPAARGTDDRFGNLLVGTTSNSIDDLHIVGNYLYHPTLADAGANIRLGYGAVNNAVELRGNFFMGGYHALDMSNWANVTVANNTFFATNAVGTGEFMTNVTLATGQSASGYSWNGNTYYDTVGAGSGGTVNDFGWAGQFRTFANWRTTTGFDSTSQYILTRPTGVSVFVQPNEYEQGRANIVVYNWSGAATVDVDVSQVLTVGATYEVRSSQNYLGAPVLTGTWTGGPLHLPLTSTTVATPIGYDFTPASTAPEFNAYVLITR